MRLLLIILSCAHALDHNDTARCHSPDVPGDKQLQCDSSSQQIVLFNQDCKQQKRNLVIFDVDNVILETVYGFHPAIPIMYRQDAQNRSSTILTDPSSGLDLLLLYKPMRCTIVFRHHFFETLQLIRETNISVELVLYASARSDYIQQVALGIQELYQRKYGNISDDSLFRMVISIKRPGTAKSISTLAHNLNLSLFERIVILDAYTDDVWCKYDLMQLKQPHKVQIHLMNCPLFHIWNDVYDEFWNWYIHNLTVYNDLLFSAKSESMKLKHFRSMVVENKQKDDELYKFLKFLQEF